MQGNSKAPVILPILLVSALATACGGTGDMGETDTSVDTASDESSDTSTDQPADTPGDTAVDTAVDTTPDTVEDTIPDAPDSPEEPACLPTATPSGDEGHRAGMDCLSCHAGMGGVLGWTIAGTLYSDASGTSPVGGATIVVRDSTGAEIDLVTHPNGNFYTTTAVGFPVTVAATRCPDYTSMGSTVANGSCNSCHGSSMRIHLP